MIIKKIIYFAAILLPAFIGYAVQANAAVQHKALYKHAKTLLLARSHSGQFSNANNFKSAMQSSVDPRTGTLSCSMVVGQLHSNWSKGPFYKLALSYTSGSSANPDGIGNGWQWNLSHYNVNTHSFNNRSRPYFSSCAKSKWHLGAAVSYNKRHCIDNITANRTHRYVENRYS